MSFTDLAAIIAGLAVIILSYIRYRLPYSILTSVMRRSYTDLSVEVFVERNLPADAFFGLGLVLAGIAKADTFKMVGWALALVGAVWMCINLPILHRREQL